MKDTQKRKRRIPKTASPKTKATPVSQGKRGRRRKKGQGEYYFGKAEEEAFRRFVESSDPNERDRIFRTSLYAPIGKMIECIMRRYDLSTPSEDDEDTMVEAMSFIYMQMGKFDYSKNKKLYSYLSAICKNFLRGKRIQDMKNTNRNIYYDRLFSDNDMKRGNDSPIPLEVLGIYNEDMDEVDGNMSMPLTTELINAMIEDIQEMLSPDFDTDLTDNERSVGLAFVEFLMNLDDLFVQVGSLKFNRTNFLFFLQESTHLPLKVVRESFARFKAIYLALKEDTMEGRADNQPDILKLM